MNPTREELLAGLGAPAGQCGTCRHALLNRTARGPVYLRCGLAATDDHFDRYPRLPMAGCTGYDPIEQAER